MKEQESYGSLKSFLKDNSIFFTILSIFLIFISISGTDFLPEVSKGVKLTTLSEFLWLSGMLIIIICLVALVKKSFMVGNNSFSVRLFGAVLFLMLFSISMYLIFSILLSKSLMGLIAELPNYENWIVALVVMVSPFAFVLIDKIKIKWLRWMFYIVLPLFSLIFLLHNGINNWFNKLIEKDIFYWLFSGILVSFFWTTYYRVTDYFSDKTQKLKTPKS